jgi:hypothetical protein
MNGGPKLGAHADVVAEQALQLALGEVGDGGKRRHAVTDWKVGSPLLFRGEWEGKAYEDRIAHRQRTRRGRDLGVQRNPARLVTPTLRALGAKSRTGQPSDSRRAK